ncbi:MAG: molybdopterin dinucleotide binding domain-containing protein [Pseudomonadota bacterium]
MPIININPFDASVRNIQDGEKVRVFNAHGDLTLVADVNDITRPGVLSMPFGW